MTLQECTSHTTRRLRPLHPGCQQLTAVSRTPLSLSWASHLPHSTSEARKLGETKKEAMMPQKEQYLFQVGVSIRVSVGEDPPVFPAARILQLQDLLAVLMIQWTLTRRLILVQIYFKLRSPQRNRSAGTASDFGSHSYQTKSLLRSWLTRFDNQPSLV